MKKILEFDTITELNRWFRENIKAYAGYYYDQYKDPSTNKWVLVLGR